MTKKRIATMATCIALVGAVAVGGTLALLSQQSNTVTNTFTIGKGYPDSALTLDEAPVARVITGTDNFGGYNAIGGDRVETNAYDNLVADTTLDKDPTFHLKAESPDSWVIAKVTGVNALSAKGITINGELPRDYGWLKLNTEDGTATPITEYAELTDGYYVTKNIVTAGNDTDDLFEELKVGANVTRGELENIVVSGVAVESVTGEWTNDGAAVVAQANTSGFIK
ncbi:SipW-dependent-type signal peptide-containing protein [Fournierella sp.]|uniref:SipW-dependent-type signal peptide-containing protein n=1 Tax=Allofournierella sp. TaxID=1940256 RepID=UPI00307AB2D4